MKINYLRLAAFFFILFEMVVIFNEFLHIHYGEIPDYVNFENISSDKYLHLAAVKKHFNLFLTEIFIAILLFIYSMKSNLVQISETNVKSNKIISQIVNMTNDNVKVYIPGFLLFLTYFIANRRDNPLEDAIFYASIYSVAFYIIFEFSYYWINFILLGWLTIQPRVISKSGDLLDYFLVSNDTLPKIIQKWFKVRDYIYKTYHIPVPDTINMGVLQEDNIINVIIMGDWNAKVSKKEFKSVLFHELGHVNYQACFYRNLWLYLVVIVTMLGYFYIYKNFMKSKKNYTSAELIYLFVYLHIITKPLILVSINGFSQYHEYLADSYSVENGFKKALKSSLKKRLLEGYYQQNYSVLYGLLFNFDHPPLVKRINSL